jgi:hypothetical protein
MAVKAPGVVCRNFAESAFAHKGTPIAANIGRTSPQCGSVRKANQMTQQTFSCVGCGYTTAADFVGARVCGHPVTRVVQVVRLLSGEGKAAGFQPAERLRGPRGSLEVEVLYPA